MNINFPKFFIDAEKTIEDIPLPEKFTEVADIYDFISKIPKLNYYREYHIGKNNSDFKWFQKTNAKGKEVNIEDFQIMLYGNLSQEEIDLLKMGRSVNMSYVDELRPHEKYTEEEIYAMDLNIKSVLTLDDFINSFI